MNSAEKFLVRTHVQVNIEYDVKITQMNNIGIGIFDFLML